MRNLLWMLAVGCLLSSLNTSTAAGQTAAEIAPTYPAAKSIDFDEAIAAFRSGDERKSIAQLRELREKQPALPPAPLMLARMHLVKGRLDLALPHMERASIENENDPEVYMAFCLLAVAQGRTTDARVLIEKALSLPVNESWSEEQRGKFQFELVAGRAVLAERQEKWGAADRWLSQQLELKPALGVHHRVARARFRQGNTEGALEQLKQAQLMDPSKTPAAVGLATLYMEIGEMVKARETLTNGRSADPKNPRYVRELANVLLIEGKDKEAHRAIVEAASLGDKSPERQMAHAMIARRLGKTDEAVSLLDGIRRSDPTNFEATNQLALVLIESPTAARKQAALRLAESNARLHSGRAEAISTLGWVYFRSGKTEDAEKLLRAAVSKGNVRTETAYFLTRVLSHQGKKADAEAAKVGLRNMMKGPGLFVLRPQAEKWLADNPSGS